jgi:hypothetical protein
MISPEARISAIKEADAEGVEAFYRGRGSRRRGQSRQAACHQGNRRSSRWARPRAIVGSDEDPPLIDLDDDRELVKMFSET